MLYIFLIDRYLYFACVGGSTTLTGSPTGGTWTSRASSTATVNSSGIVTGVAGGNAPTCIGGLLRLPAHRLVAPGAVVLLDELTIYPNPSSGAFTVSLPAGVSAEQVQITDVTGKTIKAEAVVQVQGAFQYVLSGVAPGVYMVRIASYGKVYRARLVIAK